MNIDAKAVVFPSPNKVKIQKIKLSDELSDDHILTKTLYSGVSMGTERWALSGKRPDAVFPCIPGYQNVGKIIAMGKKVKGFKIGDKVMQCAFAKLPDGLEHGCGSSHASHLIGNYNNATLLNPKVNPKHAALAWVAGCSLEGVTLTEIKKTDTVVVIGQGLIGQMSAQIAKSKGATVIAVDMDVNRLNKSKRYSSNITINAAKVSVEQEIKKLSPDGADVVIEATGNKDLIDQAIKLLKPRGRLCLQGWYPGKISLEYMEAHIKEISMHFPCAWGWKKGLSNIQKLMLGKKINVNPLITHVVKYADAPKIYRKIAAGNLQALGVVIKWN